MAITAAIEHHPPSPEERVAPYRYVLYGLHMQSDIRLPIPAEPPDVSSEPDIVVTFRGYDNGSFITGKLVAEMRCHCPAHNGSVSMRVHRSADGAWIWNDAVGECYISSNGRDIHVYGADVLRFDEHRLALLVAGIATTFILHFRGYSCLHASAIATTDAAAAFLGPTGRGKTTMAAGFVRRGAELITDDVLPLQECADGVYGLPSLPIMKLWQQSVAHGLEIDDDLPSLIPNVDKKLFTLDHRFVFSGNPVLLRAIYVLNRYDPLLSQRTDAIIQSLPRREGVAALISHSSLREYLLPEELASLFRRYAALLSSVSVRMIHYPNGFEHQNMVHGRIAEDMRTFQ